MSPTKFNPLAKKGFDKIGMSRAEAEADFLKLDQTTPQTVTGGIPLLTGLTPSSDYHIATKKYVDSAMAGGVSDGDKGDITVSGGGSIWTIDNDAITYAKIQNVSAENKILGRITTGAGNVEELTAANVRTIINVEDGAEKNVNADWNATSGDALILNKPSIPSQYTDEMAQDAVGGILDNSGNVKFTYDDITPKITATVNLTETDPVFSASEAALFVTGDAAKLAGIEAGADVTDAANVAAAGAAMAGGAFHDSFSDYVANEHIDWTVDQGATNIHSGNIPDLSDTYMTVGSVTQYTDEMAQDAVGLNVGAGLSYNDLTGSISSTITQYTDALAVAAIKADASWHAANWDTAFSWGDHRSVGYLTDITGESIGDLSDVNDTGKDTNKVLKYNAVSGDWEVGDDNNTTYTAADFNHDELSNISGGQAGEYNHITDAELTVLQATSGVNTGDQVVPQNEVGAANNFLTAYNATTGAWSKARPTWANIDKTTSNIADITTRSHTSLTDIGTLTHATIDSYLNQAVKTTSSPTFVNVKLSGLTNGYLPYHDTNGLANSPIYTDGTKVGIGTDSPTTTLDVHGTFSFANTLGDKISLYDDRIGKTGMYGFGVETSTMYYKSSRYHRWYANLNADDGASDIMELDSDGSLYVKSDICVGVTSINAAAILELSSTTKGFLPPRMTTTQRDAISSPPAGLMIFNTTTKKLNFYSGTAWEAVTSA